MVDLSRVGEPELQVGWHRLAPDLWQVLHGGGHPPKSHLGSPEQGPPPAGLFVQSE